MTDAHPPITGRLWICRSRTTCRDNRETHSSRVNFVTPARCTALPQLSKLPPELPLPGTPPSARANGKSPLIRKFANRGANNLEYELALSKHLGSKVPDLSLHLSADLIDRSLLLAPLALLGAALTGVFLLAASIVHSPAIDGSLILNHSLVAHQHEPQAQGLGKANQDKTDSYC